MILGYKDKDILIFEENFMIQQVNHQGIMGAGLALRTREVFPKAYFKYRDYCRHDWETIKKHGEYVSYLINESPVQKLCFVFGQRYYGSYGIQTDYEALRNGLKSIAELARDMNYTVAIPNKIGCGLAKGDWGIVLPMIEEIFANVDVYIYNWTKKEQYENYNDRG
jgi:O-acetyl-ADP-ribose deacetylase (regulator of RNase III)